MFGWFRSFKEKLSDEPNKALIASVARSSHADASRLLARRLDEMASSLLKSQEYSANLQKQVDVLKQDTSEKFTDLYKKSLAQEAEIKSVRLALAQAADEMILLGDKVINLQSVNKKWLEGIDKKLESALVSKKTSRKRGSAKT